MATRYWQADLPTNLGTGYNPNLLRFLHKHGVTMQVIEPGNPMSGKLIIRFASQERHILDTMIRHFFGKNLVSEIRDNNGNQ